MAISNEKLAFSGIMTGISAVLVLLTNLFQFNTLLIMLLMSLIVAIITQKNGIGWALLSFAVTLTLTLFLTGKIDMVIKYFFVFGTYPVVKFVIERKNMLIIRERVIKGIYYAVVSVIITVVAIKAVGGEAFFGSFIADNTVVEYIIPLAMIVLWYVYDIALTYVIAFYNRRFGNR